MPSATSRAWATWGADQPASVFSKIRARVVTRAVLLPARTRCSSWFRYSGVNRTPYFSLTISPPHFNPLQSQGSSFPADLMEAYRVSALVNRPSNDGPEVAAPVVVEVPPFQGDQADPPLF